MTTITNVTAPTFDGLTDVPVVLTTIFTPPCGCVNKPVHIFETLESNTIYGLDRGDTCSTWLVCDPVEYVSWVCSSSQGWIYSFSPGVCPQDWTVIGTVTTTEGKDVITSAYCCPYGFTADTDEFRMSECISHVTTSTTGILWTSSRLPCDDTIWFPAGTTALSNYTVHTWYYTAVWRSADLSSFNPVNAPLSMFLRAPEYFRSECPANSRYPISELTPVTQRLGSCTPTEAAISSLTEKPSVATFGAGPPRTFEPTGATPGIASFGVATATSSPSGGSRGRGKFTRSKIFYLFVMVGFADAIFGW